MKICWRGFAATNHSWSLCAQNISRALLNNGHQVDLLSTNGNEYFPDDLKNNLIGYVDDNRVLHGRLPDNNYDMAISYTCLKNAKQYLEHASKNRFLIWCYEWYPNLPQGFAKHHQYTDYILAPSVFAKECFVSGKVPENKVKVIPHGVDMSMFDNKQKYVLKTQKETKILVNAGQNHRRKNIDNIFRSYFKAFSKNDDVCLVAKIAKHPIRSPFDVDPIAILDNVRKEFANPAEVELITTYVPNIVELYNACDIVFGLSFTEGFNIVALEALCAGKINIWPKYSGHLDFLSNDNSLLVSGKIVKAPINHQYWEGHNQNVHFASDVDDAAEKLRYAVKNKEDLLHLTELQTTLYKSKYTWNNVAKQILELCI